MVQPLWKIVRQFLIKLNIYLPYDLAVALVDIYPREVKTYAHIKPVSGSFVYNSLKLETT